MGVSRLIRPAETTLFRRFVEQKRFDSLLLMAMHLSFRYHSKDSNATKGMRHCLGQPHRVLLLPPKARANPQNNVSAISILPRDSPCSASLQGLRNRKRKPPCVHFSCPTFLPLKWVLSLHQSELSSFHETESPTAARALLRHRCRSPYSRHRRQSLCLAGNRCPE